MVDAINLKSFKSQKNLYSFVIIRYGNAIKPAIFRMDMFAPIWIENMSKKIPWIIKNAIQFLSFLKVKYRNIEKTIKK